MEIETRVIITKLQPYSESSFIGYGLSSEFGMLHFLASGERRVSKKQFPTLALFREVDITLYRNDKNVDGLFKVRKLELAHYFDSLAEKIKAYEYAIWVCEFINKNTIEQQQFPLLYSALRYSFEKVLEDENIHAWKSSVLINFMAEEGLLPNSEQLNSSQAQILEEILMSSVHHSPLPELSDEQWQQFFNWAAHTLQYQDYQIPQMLL